MKDIEVAQRLQAHYPDCKGTPCTCDRDERVWNTFLILRTTRAVERKFCEEIAREVGSARAADRIRDRYMDDENR